MAKVEFINYFLELKRNKNYSSPKVQTYQADAVKINDIEHRPIHIDARWFGSLPAEFKTAPNALNVIIGFPEDKSEAALEKYTYIES